MAVMEADNSRGVSLDLSGPNPFNAVTQFSYYLPEPDQIQLEVFNITGQKVAKLFEGLQTAGEHKVSWSAENLASGLYFVRLSTTQGEVVRKAVLIK